MISRPPRTSTILLLVLTVIACTKPVSDREWQAKGDAVSSGAQAGLPTITISDIDPDTPTRRLRRLRPLADHIADKLGWDRSRVRVRIGRSIDEMILMFQQEEVDLFVDSGYPTMIVAEATGAELILESPVDGSRSYHAVLVASKDGPVKSIEGLRNHNIALQERYSTSGFVLPAALLLDRGMKLEHLHNATAHPGPENVGFFFTGDEENTLAMLRKHLVPAGVLSSMDYELLPNEIKQELSVLAETVEVPRKLAVLRVGIDREIRDELIAILVGISDKDRAAMVANNSWNWQFFRLDQRSLDGVESLRAMIARTAQLVIE